MPAAVSLPTGTVTFLFTDVEGSSRLWERHPDAMRAALVEHDALIEFLAEQHGGVLVRPRGEGDSRFAVFARATDAVAAAAAIQQALHAEPWPVETPIRVRLALHTGEADLRDGDYYGAAVNRCARLRAIAHGGQVVLSMATEALVRDALPAGVIMRDLGEQRLRDLARPERVFQLTVPGVSADFPPLRSLDALPNNLPLQLTSFIGRERERGEVGRLLAATRLLTLTGPGGTGKTRLALQAAAEALDAYPDGVWLAELAALADPALVPPAVAQAVGVREEPGRPVSDALADALRSKHMLVVLDNCEHLLDACARLADALLHACPRVQVLATSREALGIAGETTWRVPSLALPSLPALVDASHPAPVAVVSQFEAVRLFIDRAQVVQPGFHVTDQNAPSVAQLCARLDGIPLAIELAAARVRHLPVEQLLARLEDRFRLLTGGSRTARERHQTLQAAVDWSYGLLAAQERAVFDRLSVFAGGWTLEAAEAVCADGRAGAEDEGPTPRDESNGAIMLRRDDVLDLLSRLVDKSLVLMDEVEVEEGDGGGARYRLLETLRQYGRDRLAASGEAAAVHERHAACYLALAERAQSELHGPQQVRWLDRLEREHDNLRAALRWLGETPEPEPALRLAGALYWFWFMRGHIGEALQELTALVDKPGAAAPTAARAAALNWLGFTVGGLTGNTPMARARYEEALAISRDLDHKAGMALALRGLRRYAESLVLFHAAGDLWGAAWTLYLLGNNAVGTVEAAADVDEAIARTRDWYQQSLALSRQIGDPWGTARALARLGSLELQIGNAAVARSHFEAGLALYREVDDRQGTGYALKELGRADYRLGDYAAARAHVTRALAAWHAWGYPAGIAYVLDLLAALAATCGQPTRALRLAGAAQSVKATPGRDRQRARAETQFDQKMADARQALGEAAAAAAWAEGQAMSLDQAVAYALDGADAPAIVDERLDAR
jgi:predicted ATPase/class 3 adenylate cyclase